jgi:hypothetical protein
LDNPVCLSVQSYGTYCQHPTHVPCIGKNRSNIETWYDKDNAKHTWPNFQLHLNKHDKTRINKMTAQAARFHGTQNATPIPPVDQANAAAAQQAGKSKDFFVSNGIPSFYFWSHGLSKTLEHTIKTCKNQPK